MGSRVHRGYRITTKVRYLCVIWRLGINSMYSISHSQFSPATLRVLLAVRVRGFISRFFHWPAPEQRKWKRKKQAKKDRPKKETGTGTWVANSHCERAIVRETKQPRVGRRPSSAGRRCAGARWLLLSLITATVRIKVRGENRSCEVTKEKKAQKRTNRPAPVPGAVPCPVFSYFPLFALFALFRPFSSSHFSLGRRCTSLQVPGRVLRF